MTTRAFRNNNPGNIRQGANWQGLMAAEAMTAEQAAEETFCVFETPAAGFRALAVMLRNYRTLIGLSNVRKMISYIAPPQIYDTEAHVAFVMGAMHGNKIDLDNAERLAALCKAIAMLKSGGEWPFSDDDLASGVQAALDGHSDDEHLPDPLAAIHNSPMPPSVREQILAEMS